MAWVRSSGFTASRAALVAMTRMESEFFSRARSGKFPDGLGGVRDGVGLEPAGFVKAPAQPRLPAFLVNRAHVAPGHVGHQQLDRVGADINDRATDRLHERA